MVLPNDKPWHLTTNHLHFIFKDSAAARAILLYLSSERSNGEMDEQAAMDLRSQVAQSSTQYSAVYNMSSRDVSIEMVRSYREVFHLHLDLVHP